MSARLRVLLDVAALGYGTEPGPGRAGTFRSAEQFVEEAMRHPGLDVYATVTDSFFREVQAVRYDRAGRLGARLLRTWHHPSVSHEEVAALVDRVVASGETSPVGRRLMAEAALTNLLARPRALPEAYDVYHSLRSPLADRARVEARARALVVHDIIPLLYPETCADGADAAMRVLLASIDVERDWIFCPSECTRRDVSARLEIDPDRIFVVPWGVDDTVFHPVGDKEQIAAVRRRYGIGEAPYVLSVCTIEPRKNLGHLVRSFARLVELPAHRDLQLVLVGAKGWKTASTLAAAGAAGIGERLRWPGFVPDSDLAALYAGADVFTCASIYEGFGLPVLEAMRCDVPVVSTAGGSLPEVIGDAGILVDDLGDEDALSAAIAAARGDRVLAAAGLARAERYTWKRTLDLTVEAYRAILRLA